MIKEKIVIAGLFGSFMFACSGFCVHAYQFKESNPFIQTMRIVLKQQDFVQQGSVSPVITKPLLDPILDQDGNHVHFSILNENLIKDLSLVNYYHEKREIEKMRKIALFMSNKNRVNLNTSEEIILTAFDESKKHHIDPHLFVSLIDVESTFNPHAISSRGAIGLTQVIPKWHPEKIASLGDKNKIWSIKGNLKVGIKVLKDYIDMSHGNIVVALQKYNGSQDDETKTYARKIIRKSQQLAQIS